MIAAVPQKEPRSRKAQAPEATSPECEKQSQVVSRREFRREVMKFFAKGLRIPEIAKVMGERPARIARAVAASALPRKRGQGRVIMFHVTERDYAIIRGLCDDANLPEGTMMHRIFRATAPTKEAAQKRLGKDAMPTRRYGERG